MKKEATFALDFCHIEPGSGVRSLAPAPGPQYSVSWSDRYKSVFLILYHKILIKSIGEIFSRSFSHGTTFDGARRELGRSNDLYNYARDSGNC